MRPREPHSPENEAAVLGAILVRPQAFHEVASIISASDFYSLANRSVFSAMASLDATGQPIQVLSVFEQMKTAGDPEPLNMQGGINYLYEFYNSAITTDNVGYYAEKVRVKSERRRWMKAAQEIYSSGLSESDDDEYFVQFEAKIASLRTGHGHADEELIGEVLKDSHRALDKRFQNRGNIHGVPSGFASLDTLTSGFSSGDLVILAARPAMGKSAMMVNVAVNAAKAGHPVMIFSLEMSKQSLADRIICAESSVDSHDLRTGNVKVGDWARMAKHSADMSELPITLVDNGSLTISRIHSRARRWKVRNSSAKTPMVMVDYLQLIASSDKKNRNQEQEISEISRGLKSLAKEIDGPVIALAQLNRSLEARENKRPMLSDLRSSGAIEQDADLVLFLYREEVYKPETKKGEAELLISKHRTGPCGTVKLKWLPQYTRFESK